MTEFVRMRVVDEERVNMGLREDVLKIRQDFKNAIEDPSDDGVEALYNGLDEKNIGMEELPTVHKGDGKIYLTESSEMVLNLLTYIAGEQDTILPNGVEWCFVEDAIYWRKK